ncbi:hypothetical protein CDAR_595911 [Caerostris darwini]|uniref:Uncharacterized protein n=1 Tax=Caerostris darwini TaxID=1538125 RepID=A0AAV4Q8J1_9ARAC|nr:hypothetical protein CDAR_595911 [Caerostris darwini]
MDSSPPRKSHVIVGAKDFPGLLLKRLEEIIFGIGYLLKRYSQIDERERERLLVLFGDMAKSHGHSLFLMMFLSVNLEGKIWRGMWVQKDLEENYYRRHNI